MVREFKLDKGHGYVDYMLFLDGHPVGVCEAKPAGAPLIGVEHQVKKYVQGIPAALAAPYKPLPFEYLSTGEETLFINHFDPHARTRAVFSFHRPDILREWLTADTLDDWLQRSGGFYTAADDTLGRADQILTGDLFGLDSTLALGDKTNALLKEYEALLSKSNRDTQEQHRYNELVRIIGPQLPSATAENKLQRRAHQLVQTIITADYSPQNLPQLLGASS